MECILRNTPDNKPLDIKPFILTEADIIALAKEKAFKDELLPSDTRLSDFSVTLITGLKGGQMVLPEGTDIYSNADLNKHFALIQITADALAKTGITKHNYSKRHDAFAELGYHAGTYLMKNIMLVYEEIILSLLPK